MNEHQPSYSFSCDTGAERCVRLPMCRVNHAEPEECRHNSKTLPRDVETLPCFQAGPDDSPREQPKPTCWWRLSLIIGAPRFSWQWRIRQQLMRKTAKPDEHRKFFLTISPHPIWRQTQYTGSLALTESSLLANPSGPIPRAPSPPLAPPSPTVSIAACSAAPTPACASPVAPPAAAAAANALRLA